jgi:hypothetical protein
MKRIVVVALALLLVAALPHAAQAAGRADAAKAASKALRKELRQNGVRMHSKRVAKGARVGQGGPRAQARRVKRPAWLFWLDQAPGAGFQHASVLLLVDDRSSRVVRRKRLTWWPEVNGRRQFAGARGKKVRPKPKARASVVPGFKNDCIVTIGDRTDPYFLRGMAAMNALGQRHGMPVAAARTVADLGTRIDELAQRDPPCTDVMIYIAAHGYAPTGSNIPDVAESDTGKVLVRSNKPGGGVDEEAFDAEQLKAIMRARANLTFKLVIEACFSGMWTTAMSQPNLRVTVTSSRAGELTFLAVTDPRRGTQSKGKLELRGSEIGDPDDAGDPPPFTAGVVKAIDEWAASAAERAKGEELGKALGYAGVHREGDRARVLGWQSGRTDDRTGERPHAQPPQPVPYTISVAPSYRHIGPGESEVCFGVQTNPARPDADVRVQVSGPGVVAQPPPARTDANGFVLVRAPINQQGLYIAGIDVTARDGVTANTNSAINVTSAQGTCPGG